MIVLPCLSQTKFQINNKSYYCYTPDENRILAVLLNERIEFGELIEYKDARIELYKDIIVTMEETDKIKDTTINKLTLKLDKQIDLTNKYYDDYLLESEKSDKLRKWLLASGSVNLAFLILIILK